VSGETERNVSGWTVDTLSVHMEELRAADERYGAERDRRYSEVALEREKALQIKEHADEAALGLAREIQSYKDEKANQLREQINAERGLYVTRPEFKVVADYVTGQQGPPRAITTGTIVSLLAALSVLAALYFGFRTVQTKPTPVIVTVPSSAPTSTRP
jgi:hypothetical protein